MHHASVIKLLKPSLPSKLEEGTLGTVLEEADGYHFNDETLKLKGKKLEVRGSLLENVVLEESLIEGSSLVNVIFENVNLSNVKLGGSSIHQILFRNCKLIGTDFSESSIQNVIFDTCDMSYSNFSVCKMRNVQIKESKLLGSTFNDVKWNSILLEDSYFTECEFLHTPLKGMDFSSCFLEGIKASYEDVKGIVVDERGALALTSLLGIRIR